METHLEYKRKANFWRYMRGYDELAGERSVQPIRSNKPIQIKW